MTAVRLAALALLAGAFAPAGAPAPRDLYAPLCWSDAALRVRRVHAEETVHDAGSRRGEYAWTAGGCTVTVRYEGAVALREDRRRLGRLPRHSRFVVEERRGRERRRLEVRPSAGAQPDYEWSAQGWGPTGGAGEAAASAAWLARELPEIVRRTGFFAPNT